MQIIPLLFLFLRVFIGGYFVYAAVPKIMEPLAFATSIFHYGLVPDVFVNGIALVLPWLELIAGLALILGFKTRISAGLCGIMLIVFTLAVAWAVMNHLQIDCGCFGEGNAEEVSWWKVGKNSMLIAGCIGLWLFPKTYLSLDEKW